MCSGRLKGLQSLITRGTRSEAPPTHWISGNLYTVMLYWWFFYLPLFFNMYYFGFFCKGELSLFLHFSVIDKVMNSQIFILFYTLGDTPVFSWPCSSDCASFGPAGSSFKLTPGSFGHAPLFFFFPPTLPQSGATGGSRFPLYFLSSGFRISHFSREPQSWQRNWKQHTYDYSLWPVFAWGWRDSSE